MENKSTTDLIFVYNICEIASFSPLLQFAQKLWLYHTVYHTKYMQTQEKYQKNSSVCYLKLSSNLRCPPQLSKCLLHTVKTGAPSIDKNYTQFSMYATQNRKRYFGWNAPSKTKCVQTANETFIQSITQHVSTIMNADYTLAINNTTTGTVSA